jgi:hypothetical protein
MSIDLEAFDLQDPEIDATPPGLKDTVDYLDVILTSRRTFVYLGSFAEMERWIAKQRATMGDCDPENFALDGNIESVSQNGGMIQLNFASTDEDS